MDAVPPGVVTATALVPSEPMVGVVNVIEVDVVAVTVAATPPTATVVPPGTKLVPLIVPVVPG